MMKKIILVTLLFGIANAGYADFQPFPKGIDLETEETKEIYFRQPIGCDTIFPGSSYIYSPKCPKERPFMEISFEEFCGSIQNKKETGKCEGCGHLSSFEIFNGYEKDFDICSNREIREIRQKLYSVLKECPPNTFRSYYPSDSCVSCNNEYPQSATQEECSKCSNRIFDRETCFLKKGN